jgi:hypothetical protein
VERASDSSWDTRPLSYRIDREARIVFTAPVGEPVTFARVRLYQLALAADPAFDPTFGQLLDFTDASEIIVSADDVRLLATHSVFRAGSRRALVASGLRVFGFARMFQALTDGLGPDLRVFKDRAAAMEWLGLPGG